MDLMKASYCFRKFFGRCYNIGFVRNSLDGIMSGEELVVDYIDNHFNDHWFADPFILDVTDTEIKVLVEDFFISMYRGRISLLVIDRNTLKINDLKPILTLPTHLSYPIIWRKDDAVFIYPESGASNKLTLYELDLQQMKAIEVETLAEGDIADATMTPLFGEMLMFATSYPQKDGHVLEIYARNASKKFELRDVIVFDEIIARPAGDFFTYNGDVIRPAQESNKTYGHSVVLQKISQTADGWSIQEIRRLQSPSKTYPLGLHTFNMFKDIIVVDSIGYYHPFLSKIVHQMTSVVRR